MVSAVVAEDGDDMTAQREISGEHDGEESTESWLIQEARAAPAQAQAPAPAQAQKGADRRRNAEKSKRQRRRQAPKR